MKMTHDIFTRVYKLVSRIPRGRVTTYGEIAKALGNKKLARIVGFALNKNKNTLEVPCHRVVKSDGSVGGYSLGVEKKIALLEQEGVRVVNGKISDFEKVFYKLS